MGRLLDKFGCTWVERQVATMTAVGFLSVMRGIELRKIRTEGGCFVLRSGTHLPVRVEGRTDAGCEGGQGHPVSRPMEEAKPM